MTGERDWGIRKERERAYSERKWKSPAASLSFSSNVFHLGEFERSPLLERKRRKHMIRLFLYLKKGFLVFDMENGASINSVYSVTTIAGPPALASPWICIDRPILYIYIYI